MCEPISPPRCESGREGEEKGVKKWED